MDKSTRKAALEKKIPRNTTLDEQFDEKDAANGQDSEPMPAQEGGAMGGDPKQLLGEMAQALEMVLPSLPPEDQQIVGQALALLQQAAGGNSAQPTAQAGPAAESENYSDQKGGIPARAGI